MAKLPWGLVSNALVIRWLLLGLSGYRCPLLHPGSCYSTGEQAVVPFLMDMIRIKIPYWLSRLARWLVQKQTRSLRWGRNSGGRGVG